MERVARLLLGAASGGALGLLVAGAAGIRHPWMEAVMGALAAAIGFLNQRFQPGPLPPPPRAVLGGAVAAVSLLVNLGVFVVEAAQVQELDRRGQSIQLPLAIWPVTSKFLWLALVLGAVGIVLGVMGWWQLMRNRDKYVPARWVMLSLLTAFSSLGLGLAGYFIGRGFPFQ